MAEAVRGRDAPRPSNEWKAIAAHKERIEAWLEGDDPLRLVRVHELLVREGVEASYSSLWRFAHEELGWREQRPTVRIDDPPPAQEAQVDFGLMGHMIDGDGRRRKLWVLVVTLTLSRYLFVWPTFVQTVAARCDGLDAAWRFLGGVVRSVVPDNMTSPVFRAGALAPVRNRSFAEYAQSRAFFVELRRRDNRDPLMAGGEIHPWLRRRSTSPRVAAGS